MWFARTPSASLWLIFVGGARHDRRVLEMIALIVRSLALARRGHRELVLENMALRQHLRAFKRTTKRPRLRTRHGLFWIVLANAWRHRRMALVLVQPETVLRWHHDWLRR
jgi:hypothetical protein